MRLIQTAIGNSYYQRCFPHFVGRMHTRLLRHLLNSTGLFTEPHTWKTSQP